EDYREQRGPRVSAAEHTTATGRSEEPFAAAGKGQERAGQDFRVQAGKPSGGSREYKEAEAGAAGSGPAAARAADGQTGCGVGAGWGSRAGHLGDRHAAVAG